MGKPLSADLRERIVADVNGGNTRRGAAARFGVAPSTAVRLKARHDETGSVAAARIGRPPGSGKLGEHGDFLIGRVEDRPDITMPELAAALLSDRGIAADPSNLSKFLCKAGYSYKKNAAGGGERTRRRQGRARCVGQAAPAGHKGGARTAGVHR
jgi:transposase